MLLLLCMLFPLTAIPFLSPVEKLLIRFKTQPRCYLLCEASPISPWQTNWALLPPAHPCHSTQHAVLAFISMAPCPLPENRFHIEIQYPHSHAHWMQKFSPYYLLCTLIFSIIGYSVSFFKTVNPLNSFCCILKNTALETSAGLQGLYP